MPRKPETILRAFFEDYAAAATEGDAKTLAAAYFDTYLEASPSGVVAYEVDAKYRKALAEKSAGLKAGLGLIGTEIAIKSSNEFAPGHHLVKAQWTMRFAPEGKPPVESRFLITYLVRLEAETPKILAYVSHEDEEAVMKRDGVI